MQVYSVASSLACAFTISYGSIAIEESFRRVSWSAAQDSLKSWLFEIIMVSILIVSVRLAAAVEVIVQFLSVVVDKLS